MPTSTGISAEAAAVSSETAFGQELDLMSGLTGEEPGINSGARVDSGGSEKTEEDCVGFRKTE